MSHASVSDLEQLESDVPRAPQACGARREQFVSELNDPPDQLHGPVTECDFRPARRSEQVGDEPEIRPNHVCKEECRSAGGDDAPMDLGDFESWAYRGLDGDEIVRATELIDEGSKV
jgi:hypothetical protein